MSKVIFGVWDGEVTDNRGKRPFEIDETPEFKQFDEFDPGNPIKAFFGWKGFFIFDKDVDLIDAARQYIGRAAKESCGACAPCRAGTQILRQKFKELGKGKIGIETLDEIEKLALHVKNTSLCGLGQTCTVPILEMIKYFREELVFQIEEENSNGLELQPATTYVTAPCIEACPAKVNIPRYIAYIKDGKFNHSVGVVLQKFPMVATCGSICIRFCEFACRRTMIDKAVRIKLLKRFVADKEQYMSDKWFLNELSKNKKTDELKVAVIGVGPAGISAAYHLLLKGYSVDIFETMTESVGMIAAGIPEYQLPKEDIFKKEVSIIESLGGNIRYNERMGVDFTLDDLCNQGYKSVFMGGRAHKEKSIGILSGHRSQNVKAQKDDLGVTGIHLVKMELDEPDDSGCRRVYPIKGYDTLIEAMKKGIKAADAIDDYLTYGRTQFKPEQRMSEILQDVTQMGRDRLKIPVREEQRVIREELDSKLRKRSFEEVEKTITVEQAYKEAERCLRCYRIAMVITEK